MPRGNAVYRPKATVSKTPLAFDARPESATLGTAKWMGDAPRILRGGWLE